MEYLAIIAQILGYFTGIGVFYWLFRTLFLYYKNIRKVETINNLEAKIAVLRMLLKSKIRKHLNAIESQFRTDKIFIGLLAPKMEQLMRLDFSSNRDYSIAITLFIEFYDVLEIELVKRSPTLFKDKDSTKGSVHRLIKYGKAQIIIIKDIIEATAELKSLIETYNLEHQTKLKANFKVPEIIVINEFDSIQDLLSTIAADEQVDLEKQQVA